MKLDREVSPDGDIVSIYWCDNCGKNSGHSDYRWPGHRHWEGYNYTLCYECLIKLANSQTDIEEMAKGGSNS